MDIIDNPTQGLIKSGAIFIIGLIILSGAIGASAVGDSSSKSIQLSLTQIPIDGDTITLGNYIFEFDSGDGVIVGHITVAIGSTIDETGSNLRTAIENNTDYTVG
jgi:hypothetical protein